MVKVSEITVRDPIAVAPETPVREITVMMRERSISVVILVEDGRPLGVVSARDLVHKTLAVNGDPDALQATDVCSRPAVSISEHDEAVTALDVMKTHGVKTLVVLDPQDAIVGVVTADELGLSLPSHGRACVGVPTPRAAREDLYRPLLAIMR